MNINRCMWKDCNDIMVTYSEFLCTVKASVNTTSEAMKPIEREALLMIITASGIGLTSPQIGLQKLVMFSSKKKPSGQNLVRLSVVEFSCFPGLGVVRLLVLEGGVVTDELLPVIR